MAIDFVNLREETYNEVSRIPTIVRISLCSKLGLL